MIATDPEDTWQTITASIAEDWLLKFNLKNRSISTDTVIKYAEDIEAGRWITTHQGIAFDVNGILLDGAHRLSAIVLTGIPLRLLVVRGLPIEAREVIDQGKPRSKRDAIAITSGARISEETISIAKLILLAPLFKAQISWSSSMLKEMVDINADVVKKALAIFSGDGRRTIHKKALVVLAARALPIVGNDVLVRFMNTMVTGVGPGDGFDFGLIKFRDWMRRCDLRGIIGIRAVYQKAQYVLASLAEKKTISKIISVSDDVFPLSPERYPSWFGQLAEKFGAGNKVKLERDLRQFDPVKRNM